MDPKVREPKPIPILPAEEVWSAELGAAPAANAWMDDDRVYVGLQVDGVRALDRKTGDEIWAESVDITHPPLVTGGQLLITLPREIRSLDPRTGNLRWLRPLAHPLTSRPTAGEDMIVLADEAGDLIAVRAFDGEELWRRSLGASVPHPAARPTPGMLAFSVSDGRVVALDASSGRTLWERALPGRLSAPAAARDRVLVGSDNNFFYALDAGSGRERWRWRTGGDVIGAAAAGERVYFASLDNVLRAVNRGNGNQLWKTAVPSRPSAPPIAFDDVVVLASVAPRFDAYNGRTGAALGSFTALTDLAGVPVIDTTPTPFEVAIVALTRDGKLTALRPTGLMFPDPPLAPLLRLPGRELPREPRPGEPRRP